MEQEIRISGMYQIQDIVTSDEDIVSMGHEGCLRRLPDVTFACKVARSKRIKIVLPKLKDSDMEYVKEYLKKIIQCSKFPIEVTVNDYGTLYWLSGMENIKLVVGRILSKGFEAHPQAEYICKRYPESWKQNIMQSCMVDEDKINLLKKYHVSAMEVDVFKYTSRAIQFLAKHLEVHGGMEYSLLAVFPLCPCEKSIGNGIDECSQACNDRIRVEYCDEAGVKQGGDTSALSCILEGNVLMRKNAAIASEYLTRTIKIQRKDKIK